ncbi:MAG: IS5 family transposase [Firmicutes bacterium]|nr:IS5 family transposase [Bacillota bacterium]
MNNLSLFDYEPSKVTSRARFFAEIEPHLPIAEWLRDISPIYFPNAHKGGNQPKPLEIMLRAYLVQNFFTLSDEGCEDSLTDINSIRKFVGITAANERDIPDASTICRFRNLLIEHGIQQKLFDNLTVTLAHKGLIIKKGTIVDSTIIETTTSTRNKEGKRLDKDSTWTKKGGNFKHGYKMHNGVDANSGIITSTITTTAKTHDVTIGNELLHGYEEAVYADAGYLNIENHPKALSTRKYHIMERRSSVEKSIANLSGLAKQQILKYQKSIASKRAKAEHPFATIKRLFGFKRSPYKGLKKNKAKNAIMCTLANIWKISRLEKARLA